MEQHWNENFISSVNFHHCLWSIFSRASYLYNGNPVNREGQSLYKQGLDISSRLVWTMSIINSHESQSVIESKHIYSLVHYFGAYYILKWSCYRNISFPKEMFLKAITSFVILPAQITPVNINKSYFAITGPKCWQNLQGSGRVMTMYIEQCLVESSSQCPIHINGAQPNPNFTSEECLISLQKWHNS